MADSISITLHKYLKDAAFQMNEVKSDIYPELFIINMIVYFTSALGLQ